MNEILFPALGRTRAAHERPFDADARTARPLGGVRPLGGDPEASSRDAHEPEALLSGALEAERMKLARRVYVRLARAAIDHGTLWTASPTRSADSCALRGWSTSWRAKVPDRRRAPLRGAGRRRDRAEHLRARGVSLPEAEQPRLGQGRAGRAPALLEPGPHRPQQGERPPARDPRDEEGLPFYYLPDMDHGRKHSIFVPFFRAAGRDPPRWSRAWRRSPGPACSGASRR